MIRKFAKFMFLILLVLVITAPRSYADPVISIKNSTASYQDIDAHVLNKFLLSVKYQWGWVYQGPYNIYITEHLPTSFSYLHPTIAFHQPGGVIYVGVSEVKASGYDIYYVLTHELAETAINPNLDFYDKGKLVEIADPLINQYVDQDGIWVADFLRPRDYGWNFFF